MTIYSESRVSPQREDVVPITVEIPDDVDIDAGSLRFGTPERVYAGEAAAPDDQLAVGTDGVVVTE